MADDDVAEPVDEPAGSSVEDLKWQVKNLRRRLTEETKRRDTTIEELKAKIGDGESATLRIAELEGKLAAVEEEKALFSEGVRDSDEIDLIRFQWGKLDAKDRPAIGEYVRGLKADPSKAPKLLAPYIDAWKGGAPPADGKDKAKPPAQPRPDPNRTTVDTTDGVNGKPTQAEWDAARAAAMRGDGKPLDALKARSGLPVSQPQR